MIKVYPSLLPGEPIETHDDHGLTVEAWLKKNVKGFDPSLPEHPICVSVDGSPIPSTHWNMIFIGVTTTVEIRVMPRSGAFRSVGRALSSVASAIGSVVNAAVSLVQSIFGFILPDISVPTTRAGRQGSSIYDPNVQANRPRVGGVIPEIAGQHKTFPDYLNQPRRYFVDQRTMAVDMMLCLGVGEYLVPASQTRIGETPIGSLGQQTNLEIFSPGDSVIGHQAHQCWYNSKEVGATVGSGAGLRLKSPADITVFWDVDSVDVSGNDIVLVSGSDVPGSWEIGDRISVKIPREITMQPPSDPGVDPRAVFTGSFADLGLDVGDEVLIDSTDIGGEFIVASASSSALTLDYPDLTPVVTPTSGSYQTTIDRLGATYRIDEIETGSIVVTKLLPDGSEDEAWGGFPTKRSNNAIIRLPDDAENGDWIGPFLGCPPGEKVTGVEWDIFAPQGLGRVTDSGSIRAVTREVELQWRAVGETEWHSDIRTLEIRERVTGGVGFATSYVVSPGGTRDQLGWTFYTHFCGAITPEVRVRRTSVEATSVQDLDRLEWYALKSRLASPASYHGVTTMGLTVEGSDTISGQSENRVSCVATRILDGSPTRSIADWIRYVLDDSGWPAEDIDEDALDALDAIWTARGETFDFVHDEESTTKESLLNALRAGMSEFTIDAGAFTPVRDGARESIEHMYTPQNMLPPGLERQVSMLREDDIDGVDVEYFDSETWSNETVECRLPGDDGFRAENLRIEGVTSRARAWRIGMRERRRQRYRRWVYQFATELDALNSRYQSYVALADDVPGYGQSCLIKDVSVDGYSVTLLLSEIPSGSATVLAWRRPDGTLSGPWPIDGKDGFQVTVSATESPQVSWSRELPHALLGESDRWHFPAIVTTIRPQGVARVQVQAVNYDERVYDDDDNDPPPPEIEPVIQIDPPANDGSMIDGLTIADMISAGNYDHETDTGFFGEVPSTDLITGNALASEIGLSAGSAKNSDEPWLKFYVGGRAACNRNNCQPYILYVAKKTYREALSWNNINARNAVYPGERQVSIGGLSFDVRMITGAGEDPTSFSGGVSFDPPQGEGSEWNELIYRVHTSTPSRQPGQNWATYSNEDLEIGLADTQQQTGPSTWCQETQESDTANRLHRGWESVAYFSTTLSANVFITQSWRPTLQLLM